MSILGYSKRIEIDQEYLETCLAFARSTLLLAGKEILPLFRTPLESHNKLKQGFDPVTLADKTSEALIRKEIQLHFPEHGIYGEELGLQVGNGLTWVIDPIDGTRGFVTGTLHWGMLLALFDGETPILGVVYQPYTEEMFYGRDDSSWFKRGTDESIVLKTSSCIELGKAFLGTTDQELFDEEHATKFRRLRKRVRICRFGGDCYSYCALAMGFLDIAIDPGLQPYDIQALIPIVKGAGGEITTFDGGDPSLGGDVVASANAVLHEQVLSMLNQS